MPEYLAPGVYVEEVSFRSKSLEGVPTSTTGFAGMTRFGPVQYTNGPNATKPRLITSFTEFERVYGGLEALYVGDNAENERLAYVAHAARAFFENGGKRLYIARVFASRPSTPAVPPAPPPPPTNDFPGVAKLAAPVDTGASPLLTATWRARWPGRAGNVRVTTTVTRSGNIAYTVDKVTRVQRVRPGDVVEVLTGAETPKDPPVTGALHVIDVDTNGNQVLINSAGSPITLLDTYKIHLLELRVGVSVNRERTDIYGELSTSPLNRRYIARILDRDDPADEDAAVWLDWDPPSVAPKFLPARLMLALLASGASGILSGGHDGVMPQPGDLLGAEASADNDAIKATGLCALGEIDDIAIVALPDGGTYALTDDCVAAADKLITHAEKMRYRIAIVDAPEGSSLTEVRKFRGRFDSSRAALYHPWIEILDPSERPSGGSPPRHLILPPSGFIAGVYARTDITRGVHKAPANEVVRGLVRFESNINTARQEVLNPEGINALRALEGRGNRVWGARTMTSDPEWKYVNVRRLFNYLEHSIDKGTQWAVFEPNNRRLWDNVRRTIEDFLLVLWKDGALLGDSPKEAYFVRCDRTTMTQNDIDNGRLICLVGLAPVKPAEFVIFRVGQWTADAKV